MYGGACLYGTVILHNFYTHLMRRWAAGTMVATSACAGDLG
jgi:hypothetical protein